MDRNCWLRRKPLSLDFPKEDLVSRHDRSALKTGPLDLFDSDDVEVAHDEGEGVAVDGFAHSS